MTIFEEEKKYIEKSWKCFSLKLLVKVVFFPIMAQRMENWDEACEIAGV